MRTLRQRRLLILRRIIFGFINVSFIGGCVYGILWTNINKSQIMAFADKEAKKISWISPELAKYSSLAPTLVVTIANSLIAPVTEIIAKLEKYDFEYERINQEIWRIWIGKIINTLIFVIINVQRATTIEILPQNLIDFNGSGQNFDCQEDEAAMELLKLCVQEGIIKSGILF